MKKVLLGLCALTIMATSCKKDGDESSRAQVTPTPESLAGTYSITKRVIKTESMETDDTNSSWVSPCMRDNLHKLNADMTYEMFDTNLKCDPDASFTNTWNLNSTTSITINGRSSRIDSYDGKDLVVSIDYSQYSAGTRYVTIYTKQ